MRRFLFLTAVLLVGVAIVSASSLCTAPGTIGSNIVNPPGVFACNLGGLEFSNFSASGAPAAWVPAIWLTAGNPTDPWQKQTGVFGNVVNLFFQTNFNEIPAIARDILFSYTVSNAHGVFGVDAWMGGVGPRGIAETVCIDNLCGGVDDPVGSIVLDSGSFNIGSTTLHRSWGTLFVQKDITLSGSEGNPSTMSEFSQSFETGIPEPATFGLIGGGLLLLGLLRRRSS